MWQSFSKRTQSSRISRSCRDSRRFPRLLTGDILLVHDDSWSDWLSMLRFRSWWTHAAVYYNSGRTAEMTDKNFRMLTFRKRYVGRKLIVLRFSWVSADDRMNLRNAVSSLRTATFDRLRLVIPGLPQLRKNTLWCTTFVEEVYRRGVGLAFDFLKVMRGDGEYIRKLGLSVIWDYRRDGTA